MIRILIALLMIGTAHAKGFPRETLAVHFDGQTALIHPGGMDRMPSDTTNITFAFTFRSTAEFKNSFAKIIAAFGYDIGPGVQPWGTLQFSKSTNQIVLFWWSPTVDWYSADISSYFNNDYHTIIGSFDLLTDTAALNIDGNVLPVTYQHNNTPVLSIKTQKYNFIGAQPGSSAGVFPMYGFYDGDLGDVVFFMNCGFHDPRALAFYDVPNEAPARLDESGQRLIPGCLPQIFLHGAPDAYRWNFANSREWDTFTGGTGDNPFDIATGSLSEPVEDPWGRTYP
jgi:hypothetical protein